MVQMRTWTLAIATTILAAMFPAVGQTWLAVDDAGAIQAKSVLEAAAPETAVLASDLSGFTVGVLTPGIALAARSTTAGEFAEIAWPDASVLGDVGAPAIPVVRKLFVIPDGATWTLRVDVGAGVTVDAATLGHPLLPVQAPIEKLPGAIEQAPFVVNDAAYVLDAALPAERATATELGIVREQRIGLLEIRPVSYNAAANTVTLYPDLVATVQFEGGRAAGSPVSPMPGLKRIVLNPEQVPANPRGDGNYLIITAPLFQTQIVPFASFKASQGYTVSTWVAPAGSTTTSIKTYITGLWGTASAPDYILLVGDTDTIPAWTGGGEGSPMTDIQYGCMNGASDWYPDIAIGRFPARTTAQLDAMLAKTLYVLEANFADPDYLMRAVFMASSDNYTVSEGTHNWCITNYMTPLGYTFDKLYCHTYNATTAQVTAAFNAGRYLAMYSGHGSNTSWADGPVFSQANVNALTNANKYPVVHSFACVTGSFTDTECFMETWMRAPNKGAVTALGSSVNSYWTEDDVLQRRLFDVIYDDDDEVPTETGPVYLETKMRYLAQMGTGATTRRYFEMYNLMGDPALWLIAPPTAPRGLKVSPGTSLNAVGQMYGPFTPNTLTYTLENRGDYAIDYTISKTQPWVLIDSTGGTLPPLGTATVTVALGPAANVLANGTHADTIQFTNTTDGYGSSTRTVTLKIGVPMPQLLWNLDTNPGWTVSGGQWAWGTPTGGGGAYGCKDPNSGHTGNKVYGYNLGGDYTNSMPEYHLTTTAINCTGMTQVQLKFWRWLGVESPTYDHAYVRVSNNGTTFTNVWSNDAQIADGAWVPVEYDISAYADNKPAVYIRWTQGVSDSSWTFCGWNIDDVEIWGVPPTAPEPCDGDMDCSGVVDFFDIDPFVEALSFPNGAGWPHACVWLHGDCNDDGNVDFFDIDAFVQQIGQTCP